MPVFFQILWAAASFLLIYTYFLYPLFLLIIKSVSSRQDKAGAESKKLPLISCIISVYNEELIISQKLQSILDSDYPKELLHIFIGSDGSTDESNNIIQLFRDEYNCVHIYIYESRNGKSTIIDHLTREALRMHSPSENHILVYTDANVLFEKDTLRQLANSFSDKQVAVVDSRIIQKGIRKDGISQSEKDYMSLEIQLKYIEGQLWGMSMGAFGGCYGLRSTYAIHLPKEIIVDDFYISMHAMLSGGKCITNLDAKCYENIPNQFEEEFKRKQRISSGNFLNLSLFTKLNLKWRPGLYFVFISHKVLRWFGPVLIIVQILSSMILAFMSFPFFTFISYLNFVSIVILPITDIILRRLDIHLRVLRGWRYFITMNIALFCGLILYLKGLNQSTWEPPKRLI